MANVNRVDFSISRLCGGAAQPQTFEYSPESVAGVKKAVCRIIGVIRKLLTVMDGDAIFKSKDWPYLWRK